MQKWGAPFWRLWLESRRVAAFFISRAWFVQGTVKQDRRFKALEPTGLLFGFHWLKRSSQQNAKAPCCMTQEYVPNSQAKLKAESETGTGQAKLKAESETGTGQREAP